MRTLFLLLGALLVILVGSLIFGGSDKKPTTRTNNQTAIRALPPQSISPHVESSDTQIDIVNQSFSPADLTIKAGTTVTWVNQSASRHSISRTSSGPPAFGSTLLTKGRKYTFTFEDVGTYTYQSSTQSTIKGTIIVVE